MNTKKHVNFFKKGSYSVLPNDSSLKNTIKLTSRLTIRKKILGSFMVVICLVAIMSCFTYFTVGELNSTAQKNMEQNLEKIQLAEELAIDVANEAVAMRRFNFTGDLADVAAFESHRKYGDDKISKLEGALSSEQAVIILQELKKNKNDFDTIAAKSIQAKRQNDIEQVALYMQQAGAPSEKTIASTKTLIQVVKQYISEVEAKNNNKAHGVQLVLVIVSLLVAGLSILISIYISRSIASSVNTINKAAAKIADGNLKAEDIEIQSGDEIGELGISFNKMKSNLCEVIQKLSYSVQQVTSSSEVLNTSADYTAQSANQITVSITELAQGAEAQLDMVHEMSAAIQQMLTSIQQIAVNTNRAAERSTEATNTATEGGNQVELAVRQMQQIEHSAQASAQIITDLGEKSDQIGEIVKTIAGIARQTNLLALNAAIEAARAGEQGRGFAVVADEVRNLAEQSQDAAKKIAELIKQIQDKTDKAVTSMQAGTKDVKTGVEVIHTTGKAFEDTKASILEVSRQVNEISAAIQQAVSGSQQIASSVESFDVLSKKASTEAMNISAATEEQSSSVEEVAASSKILAQMAQELQGVINKFSL